MSEYKENTVGWWLSQLKEPLKSRALDIGARITTDGLNEAAESMPVALTLLSVCMYRIFGDKDHFWTGVFSFFNPIVYRNTQGMALTSPEWSGGMYMAEKCAPDNWLKPKDGGEDKAIVDSPAPKAFEGFNKWMEAHGNPNLSPKELLNLNEYPKILYDETFLYPGESPKPKDSWQESQDMGTYSAIRNHPKLGEKQPEPAVVGYEIPKPIDTIEKKHELRIQNLERRVKDLEAHLCFYLGIKDK